MTQVQTSRKRSLVEQALEASLIELKKPKKEPKKEPKKKAKLKKEPKKKALKTKEVKLKKKAPREKKKEMIDFHPLTNE